MKPNTNHTSIPQETAARQRWMGVLARAEAEQLQTALSTLEPSPEYEYLRPPEIGMAMVRGRAGGNGQAFNLGEMTVTRCSLKLQSGQVGHGYVAGRNKQHAELAALMDALLQSPAFSDELERSLITPLEDRQREKRMDQASKTAATRVNFFTMVRGED